MALQGRYLVDKAFSRGGRGCHHHVMAPLNQLHGPGLMGVELGNIIFFQHLIYFRPNPSRYRRAGGWNRFERPVGDDLHTELAR